MDLTAIDWRIWTPVLSALGGVLVGSLIKLIYDEIQWRRQRRQKDEERRRAEDERARVLAHAALEVSFAIEDYALDCADVLSDNLNANGTDWVPVREMPPWPSSIDWRVFEAAKLGRIRQLTVRSRLVRLRAGAQIDQDGGSIPGQASDTWAEAAAEIGLDAWTTAQQVRADHGLPAFAFDDGQWRFNETMEAHLQRISEHRNRMQQQIADFLAANRAPSDPVEIKGTDADL